jgi:Sulfotransferase family
MSTDRVNSRRNEKSRDGRVAIACPAARPNFLVIGAAKSGTTALWHYLRQHPQIYMSPRKHTRFFAFSVEEPGFRGPGPKSPDSPYAFTEIEAYHGLFDGVTNETAIGEASHSYLYRSEAPRRIQRYAPGMKLIAMLRHPVDRAYSHYNQMIRDGREPLEDFTRALEEEEARIRDYWWPDFHYVQIGLYHAQLQRYFGLFEHDQIKVYLYEDFNSDPLKVLRDILEFLEVDDTFVPQAAVKYNASGIPKNKTLHSSLHKLRRIRPVAEKLLPKKQYQRLLHVGSSFHNRNLTKPRLSPEVRRRVFDEYFRGDVLKLQYLLQRGLSTWLV